MPCYKFANGITVCTSKKLFDICHWCGCVATYQCDKCNKLLCSNCQTQGNIQLNIFSEDDFLGEDDFAQDNETNFCKKKCEAIISFNAKKSEALRN